MFLKSKKLISITSLIILLILSITFPLTSNATNDANKETITILRLDNPAPRYSSDYTIDVNDINGKEFFIKNYYSGQYLDVSGGVIADGTNVQQYKYNGTDSQRWYINYNGDGTFSFYSRLNTTGYYTYALDISNGSGDNYANVQIYQINNTDAQKFQIGLTSFNGLVLYTKVSNFSKAVVLNGPTFDQGRNVDQYTYQGHVNEQWLLEPVDKTASLGLCYAQKNYNNNLYPFPNVSGLGGDCADFASQCMLASGIHYQNNWYTYRKSESYSAPTTIAQLNNSWELADPSPWISAKQFSNYWKGHVTYNYYKGSEIVNNPSLAYNLGTGVGDVVQYAGVGLFNTLGDAEHTMYIVKKENSDYKVNYHSSNSQEVSLLSICSSHPDKYFIFYRMI